jgi:hypothetical protein
MNKETQAFTIGDQIAYLPDHAEGDLNHPDVQVGFVTSVRGDTVFCRYWLGSYSKPQTTLRTQANSEGTPIRCLVKLVSSPISDEHVRREHWRIWGKE